MYRQEPDPVDWALTDKRVQDPLLPIACAVAESPAARWWPEPVARDIQRYVESDGAGWELLLRRLWPPDRIVDNERDRFPPNGDVSG